jgi:hypothetical protein
VPTPAAKPTPAPVATPVPAASPPPAIELALEGILYARRGSRAIVAGKLYAEGAEFVSSGTPVRVVAIAPRRVTFESRGQRFERELVAPKESPK